MSATFNKPEKMAQRILEAGEKLEDVQSLAMQLHRPARALRAFELIEELRMFWEEVLSDGDGADTQTFSRRAA